MPVSSVINKKGARYEQRVSKILSKFGDRDNIPFLCCIVSQVWQDFLVGHASNKMFRMRLQ